VSTFAMLTPRPSKGARPRRYRRPRSFRLFEERAWPGFRGAESSRVRTARHRPREAESGRPRTGRVRVATSSRSRR
jgi:hypothetical protein